MSQASNFDYFKSLAQKINLQLKTQAFFCERFISIWRFALACFLALFYFNHKLGHNIYQLETIPILTFFFLSVFFIILNFNFSTTDLAQKPISGILIYLYILTDCLIIFWSIYQIMPILLKNLLLNETRLVVFMFSGFFLLLASGYLILNNLRQNIYSSIFALIIFSSLYIAFWFIIPSFKELLANNNFWVVFVFYLALIIGAYLGCALISMILLLRWQKIFVSFVFKDKLDRFPHKLFPPQRGKYLDFKIQSLKATIVFVEIRNFRLLSQKLDLETEFSLINRWLELAEDILSKAQAAIESFSSSSITALFLNRQNPKHASQAVQTAIKLLQRINNENELRSFRQQPLIKVGVGIHTGQIALGAFGPVKAKDLRASGNAILIARGLENLGRRLEAPLLLSQTVVNELDPQFAPLKIGRASLEGSFQQLEVYKIDILNKML